MNDKPTRTFVTLTICFLLFAALLTLLLGARNIAMVRASVTPSLLSVISPTPRLIPTRAPVVLPLPPPLIPTGNDPVLVGAGDIGDCANIHKEQTASLLDVISGTVIAIGDLAYDAGSPNDYAACYDPSWGRFKARTKPVPGNHDYYTPHARGYFNYFGSIAGDPTKGYYSYNLGAWHIIALNSNCDYIGGCKAGSPEEVWLRADLQAHPAACTLAYWHHPLFGSGEEGSAPAVKAFWQDLYNAGADVVVNGHNHDYERFAPQDPSGQADPVRGIREFVVGTGGGALQKFNGVLLDNSEMQNNTTFGVLKLVLHPTGYDWAFIPVDGQTFSDVGYQNCHNAKKR